MARDHGLGLFLCLVCHLGFHAAASRTLQQEGIRVEGELVQANATWLRSSSEGALGTANGGLQVQLCECERAEGEPDGLGCGPKQGWFISNFEHEGTWMGGGGLVPLSHAVCCRPCLPDVLPPQLSAYVAQRALDKAAASSGPAGTTNHPAAIATATSDHSEPSGDSGSGQQALPLPATRLRAAGDQPAKAAGVDAAMAADLRQPAEVSLMRPLSLPLPANISPVALVSVGCHASSGHTFQALTCEPRGASFVTGFSHAEQVSAFYQDIYYPLSQVECCTPAVLLPGGEMWPLVRCNCFQSYTKDCGGQVTNALLWGFSSWRVSRSGELLPVAPLECCQLCLADVPTAAASCQDLSLCNGAGLCVLGACQCFEGYGGADCSVPQQGGDDGLLMDLPWWAVCLVLAGTGMLLYACMMVGRLVHDAVLGSDRRGNRHGDILGLGLGSRALERSGEMLLRSLLQAGVDSPGGSVGSRDTDEEDEAEVEEEEGVGEGGTRQGRGRRTVQHDVSQGHMLEFESGEEGEDGEEEEEGEEGQGADGEGDEEEEEDEEILGAWSPEAGTVLQQGGGTGEAEDTQTVASTRRGGARWAGGAAVAVAPDARLRQQMSELNEQLIQAATRVEPEPGRIAAAAAAAAAPAPAQQAPSQAVSEQVAGQARVSDQGRSEARPVAGRQGSDEARVVEQQAGAGGGTPPAAQGGAAEGRGATTGQESERRGRGTGAASHALTYSDEPTTPDDECAAAHGRQPVHSGTPLCVVCMEAPIQVALVPCGHANCCRKCSRRLDSCPICRKLIGRRQRLYFGAG